ncbi:MAG: hypothetical protein EXS14_01990 [Planctomycetes bacterium]|nr:hypothetical protein [Planctomycetota bacterium]
MNCARCCIVFLAFCAAFVNAQAALPTPESVLGFAPGTDGKLADTTQIMQVMRALDASSERVSILPAGHSTEGRALWLVAISSPANLKNLEQIRQDNLRLADPRGMDAQEEAAVLARAKTIVLVNESIHSNEVGPAQASMVLAWRLASGAEPALLKALDDVVVLLNPCHNPDGYDTVVHHWNATAANPATRGAPLPVLYHKYVGHDNNRDWFMLTQQESRATVEHMHLRWRPQIVLDQHQMGGFGARMFCPPYIDPYEPHVHPRLVQALDRLGRHMVAHMTQQDLSGVWCNRQFDAWTPARAFMHYHGAVRVLTEVASSNGADPIAKVALLPFGADDAAKMNADNPKPWKGGRWALADIVRYCHTAAESVVLHAAKERVRWLGDFLQIHRDFCAARFGPAGYAIPADQPRRAALLKLLDILHMGAIEVERTSVALRCGERTLPPGTFVVRNGQPCFGFVAALFEKTPYPEIRLADGRLRPPYDVTAHHLPSLMDLEVLTLSASELPAAEATDTASTQSTRAARPTQATLAPPARAEGKSVLLDPRDDGALVEGLRLLQRGVAVERLQTAVVGMVEGALLVRDGAQVGTGVATVNAPEGAQGVRLRGGRIGLYNSWCAEMDEGWTRYFFDMLGVPFSVLHDADMRAGNLTQRVDVVVLASVNKSALQGGRDDKRSLPMHRGGLSPQGASALREFVEAGGTLVAMGASTTYALRELNLPIEIVKTARQDRRFTEDATPREAASTRFNIPGSLLHAEPRGSVAFTAGLPHRFAVFFDGALSFDLTTSAEPLVEGRILWAQKDLLAVGWAEGAEQIAGKTAAILLHHGKGHVALFGFSPQFRTQTWGTFRPLLNVLLTQQADG